MRTHRAYGIGGAVLAFALVISVDAWKYQAWFYYESFLNYFLFIIGAT